MPCGYMVRSCTQCHVCCAEHGLTEAHKRENHPLIFRNTRHILYRGRIQPFLCTSLPGSLFFRLLNFDRREVRIYGGAKKQLGAPYFQPGVAESPASVRPVRRSESPKTNKPRNGPSFVLPSTRTMVDNSYQYLATAIAFPLFSFFPISFIIFALLCPLPPAAVVTQIRGHHV